MDWKAIKAQIKLNGFSIDFSSWNLGGGDKASFLGKVEKFEKR